MASAFHSTLYETADGNWITGPTFSEKDLKSWVSEMKEFLGLLEIPIVQQVYFSSFYIIGSAGDVVRAHRNQISAMNWSEFVQFLGETFDNTAVGTELLVEDESELIDEPVINLEEEDPKMLELALVDSDDNNNQSSSTPDLVGKGYNSVVRKSLFCAYDLQIMKGSHLSKAYVNSIMLKYGHSGHARKVFEEMADRVGGVYSEVYPIKCQYGQLGHQQQMSDQLLVMREVNVDGYYSPVSFDSKALQGSHIVMANILHFQLERSHRSDSSDGIHKFTFGRQTKGVLQYKKHIVWKPGDTTLAIYNTVNSLQIHLQNALHKINGLGITDAVCTLKQAVQCPSNELKFELHSNVQEGGLLWDFRAMTADKREFKDIINLSLRVAWYSQRIKFKDVVVIEVQLYGAGVQVDILGGEESEKSQNLLLWSVAATLADVYMMAGMCSRKDPITANQYVQLQYSSEVAMGFSILISCSSRSDKMECTDIVDQLLSAPCCLQSPFTRGQYQTWENMLKNSVCKLLVTELWLEISVPSWSWSSVHYLCYMVILDHFGLTFTDSSDLVHIMKCGSFAPHSAVPQPTIYEYYSGTLLSPNVQQHLQFCDGVLGVITAAYWRGVISRNWAKCVLTLFKGYSKSHRCFNFGIIEGTTLEVRDARWDTGESRTWFAIEVFTDVRREVLVLSYGDTNSSIHGRDTKMLRRLLVTYCSWYWDESLSYESSILSSVRILILLVLLRLYTDIDSVGAVQVLDILDDNATVMMLYEVMTLCFSFKGKVGWMLRCYQNPANAFIAFKGGTSCIFITSHTDATLADVVSKAVLLQNVLSNVFELTGYILEISIQWEEPLSSHLLHDHLTVRYFLVEMPFALISVLFGEPGPSANGDTLAQELYYLVHMFIVAHHQGKIDNALLESKPFYNAVLATYEVIVEADGTRNWYNSGLVLYVYSVLQVYLSTGTWSLDPGISIGKQGQSLLYSLLDSVVTCMPATVTAQCSPVSRPLLQLVVQGVLAAFFLWCITLSHLHFIEDHSMLETQGYKARLEILRGSPYSKRKVTECFVLGFPSQVPRIFSITIFKVGEKGKLGSVKKDADTLVEIVDVEVHARARLQISKPIEIWSFDPGIYATVHSGSILHHTPLKIMVREVTELLHEVYCCALQNDYTSWEACAKWDSITDRNGNYIGFNPRREHYELLGNILHLLVLRLRALLEDLLFTVSNSPITLLSSAAMLGASIRELVTLLWHIAWGLATLHNAFSLIHEDMDYLKGVGIVMNKPGPARQLISNYGVKPMEQQKA